MDCTQAVYQFKKNKNIKIAFGNYEKPFNFDSFTDGINQDYTWLGLKKILNLLVEHLQKN